MKKCSKYARQTIILNLPLESLMANQAIFEHVFFNYKRFFQCPSLSIVVDMFGLVGISVDTESIVVDISCVVKSDVVESEVVKSEVVKSEVVKSEVAKSEVVKSAAVVLSKVGVVKSSSGVVVSIIGPFSPVTLTGSSVVTGANPQSIAGYCSLKSSRIPNKVQSCSSVQQASSYRRNKL
jgi:hypothetical protein